MKRYLKWGLLLSWMIIIFIFSAQNGQQSAQSSGIIEKILTFLPFIPNKIFGIDLQLIIRKLAHFSEYAILYLLMYQVMIDFVKIKYHYVLALLGVFIYACSDEIHQAFVPGRACMFTDVLIDTFGGAFMMALIYLINYCIKEKS